MSGFTELVKIIARTSDTDECIEWPGARYKNNYGALRVGGKQWTVSRYVKMIADGLDDAPVGLVARHTCDNPPCMNPRHLVWGTNQENSDDKVSRGRHAYGERVSSAKLTDALVTEAREYFLLTRSLLMTRNKYGLSINACRKMLLGETWRHVSNPIPTKTFDEIVRRAVPESEISEITARRGGGQSWQEIATEMGYGSAMTPLRIFNRYGV